MTLNQLQYFIVLARTLHYTKSAEQLHISQPSLSYSITELEKELGVPLFDKKNKKIFLNQNGKLFLHYAEKVMSLLEEGVSMVKTLNEVKRPRIRLGYFYSLSSPFIPDLISQFYKENEHSEVLFDFVQEQDDALIQMVQDGTLDLTFCLTDTPKLETIPITQQLLYLTVPNQHPLADRQYVHFEDFCQEPMVLLTAKSHARKMVDKMFGTHQVVPKIIFEAVECNAALQFVSLGAGVSILPKVPALDSMPVRYLPIEQEMLSRTVYLAWLSGKPFTPAMTAFHNFIQKTYK